MTKGKSDISGMGSEACALNVRDPRPIKWRTGRGRATYPESDIVKRLFETPDDWRKGKLRREADAILRSEPPALETLDLTLSPVKLSRVHMDNRPPRELKNKLNFWKLCRLLGCDRCAHLYRSSDTFWTCRLNCQAGNEAPEDCKDCPRLPLCSFATNPILSALRAYYSFWASSTPAVRRMILLLVIFGTDGGRPGPRGKNRYYRLMDLARMAGLIEKRAKEKVKGLLKSGIIEVVENSRPPHYRYVYWGNKKSWRMAESEFLRHTINRVMDEHRPGSRRKRGFDEGKDYVLLRSDSPFTDSPRVVLGTPPPRWLLTILDELDASFDEVWRKFLMRAWAEIAGSLEAEKEELRLRLLGMVEKITSMYSDLTPQELKDLLKYLDASRDKAGPNSIVIYSIH